jgi:adenosylmethionine-8-amino-7-oxononanoate aminotransferase
MKHKDYVDADRRALWHPFTQHSEWLSYEPLIVERAEGYELIDTEGRRYLDGVSSLWCNVHGHSHPRIVEAMKAQLDRVTHSTLLGLSHVPAIRLAERLVELTPAPLTRVFFTDAGATAVEAALRIAFQYWIQRGRPEKREFITLDEAYHGDTIGSVSLGFSEPFHRGYEPLTFRVAKFAPPFLCEPLGGLAEVTPEALEEAARRSEALLERHLATHAGETAALFLEPLVQGAAGIWPQPPSFLRRVRALCDAHDVLLVCDEVATGFGRTGSTFAVEQAEIAPDILCLAKGLTGGTVPVAATLAREEIFEAFRGPYSSYRALFHGHTYGGNPLGCAAALANLEVYEEERTLENARHTAGRLAKTLAEHVEPLRHTGPVRQVGLMIGFDILREPETGTPYDSDERVAHRAVLAARDEGVIIRPLGDTMVLMPAPGMPAELAERVVEVTARAIARVTEG